MELPYDLTIPLLGMYPEKTVIRKDTGAPALFTIAKTWNQPTCPSTDKWTNNMWYIKSMEYDSAIKE